MAFTSNLVIAIVGTIVGGLVVLGFQEWSAGGPSLYVEVTPHEQLASGGGSYRNVDEIVSDFQSLPAEGLLPSQHDRIVEALSALKVNQNLRRLRCIYSVIGSNSGNIPAKEIFFKIPGAKFYSLSPWSLYRSILEKPLDPIQIPDETIRIGEIKQGDSIAISVLSDDICLSSWSSSEIIIGHSQGTGSLYYKIYPNGLPRIILNNQFVSAILILIGLATCVLLLTGLVTSAVKDIRQRFAVAKTADKNAAPDNPEGKGDSGAQAATKGRRSRAGPSS